MYRQYFNPDRIPNLRHFKCKGLVPTIHLRESSVSTVPDQSFFKPDAGLICF